MPVLMRATSLGALPRGVRRYPRVNGTFTECRVAKLRVRRRFDCRCAWKACASLGRVVRPWAGLREKRDSLQTQFFLEKNFAIVAEEVVLLFLGRNALNAFLLKVLRNFQREISLRNFKKKFLALTGLCSPSPPFFPIYSALLLLFYNEKGRRREERNKKSEQNLFRPSLHGVALLSRVPIQLNSGQKTTTLLLVRLNKRNGKPRWKRPL